jgi:oligoendopeptidase F
LTQKPVTSHADIAPQYTWNAPSVFESDAAWEAEVTDLSASLGDFGRFQDRLASGPALLIESLSAFDDIIRRMGKIDVYASIGHSVNTADQAAARASDRSGTLWARVSAAVSFLEPELLAIGQDTLRAWMAGDARLAVYGHYVDNLFRKQAHVRSAEVEELLGLLNDPFRSVGATAHMLTNADFQFTPALSADSHEMPLTQGTLMRIMADPDREARRTAWENYHGLYLAYKNTLAANLITSVKQNVFEMRARRHRSTLEASLFENDIPVQVFHNLIDTFRANLPTWHRYWGVRRRALGVETLYPYDIWAPLASSHPDVPYEQAVEWICQGLAPMGDEYVRVLRRGCLEDRWVDVYPTQGKVGGAFSSGRPGTHPFIVMSYNDNILSLSTLAHELGHSMHSYLTWQSQPMIYSDYSLFLAEVASNFHQAMVRGHLLQRPDPAFQLSVIEEAMSNFYRYFFIMPTLARFELETHQRMERGQGLTADDMISLMADLWSEGYGDGVQIDRQREGIIWATFGHLYEDYYVYQYATGISGANALSRRILSGQAGATEDYLRFLKAGSSVYALDALKMAGVDLATPEPVEVAFEVLSDMVDRLEALVGRQQVA